MTFNYTVYFFLIKQKFIRQPRKTSLISFWFHFVPFAIFKLFKNINFLVKIQIESNEI